MFRRSLRRYFTAEGHRYTACVAFQIPWGRHPCASKRIAEEQRSKLRRAPSSRMNWIG